ncbi:MAG TPA: hypothetical protein H9692_00615 [Firmicutes bacterium]|nr:hypothetical protein [Bacillota bacterium]
MRKSISVLLSIVLAAAVCVCVAGCGASDAAENNAPKAERWNIPAFVEQTECAEAVYDGVYEKISGRFGVSRVTASAASSGSAREAGERTAVGIDEVKDIFASVIGSGSYDIVGLVNSYVGDIFTYGSLQLALMREYESESLIGTYNAEYDWQSAMSAYPDYANNPEIKRVVSFQRAVAPTEARFPGAEKGRTYISQKHMGGGVSANLEYICDDETGDMSVTTINYHENTTRRFEYHYCEADENFVLVAYGTYDEEYNVDLETVCAYTENVTVAVNVDSGAYYGLDDGEISAIFDYVYSETERINGKITASEEQNYAAAEAAGYESPEVRRGVRVVPDLSVLAELLGI